MSPGLFSYFASESVGVIYMTVSLLGSASVLEYLANIILTPSVDPRWLRPRSDDVEVHARVDPLFHLDLVLNFRLGGPHNQHNPGMDSVIDVSLLVLPSSSPNR